MPDIFTPALSLPRRMPCLLYTSDAADERSSVDLGGRRIIKKKNNIIEDATQQLRETILLTNNIPNITLPNK